MSITYTKVGDYYLPNLNFPDVIKNSEIGKYGKLRLNYLRKNKKEIYVILRMENKLKEHLIFINKEAKKRIKNLINDMCIREKVNENLKEKEQMKWVGTINNFKNMAEEIILKELIYV